MSRLRSIGRWLLAGGLLAARRRGGEPPPDGGRTLPEHRASRRVELTVVALLLLAAAAAVAFMVVYATGADTQGLGLAMGACLGALAAAAIVAGKALVPQQEVEEERPPMADPPAEERVAGLVREGGTGISRRRLLGGAAALAGVAAGAAAATPLLSLGPGIDDRTSRTPWRAGRPLVYEDGRRVAADDLVEGSFVTAFPQGAPRDELGSPLIVVRVDPDELRLPEGREGWAPRGILAFSKICTHAACAVSEYRYPLFPPESPRPALVCPCHYSTFDVLRAAEPVFGPAVRALPQLPLAIDPDGFLVATGGYSGDVGPSWLLTDA